MKTCKKFNKEVAEVLYGMNRYIFDIRSDTLIASPLQRGDINKFNSTRSQIPGMPDIYGRPRGRKLIMETLERMFDLDDDQDTWLSENPFTAFLRRIGPYNASLLTKIEFEDHFKVGRAGNFDNDPRPLGFAHLLPIYKTILYYACPNLQELTLHVGFCEMWPKQLNPDYPHIKGSSNTTEEKVYDTLRLLIQGLPWLRKLQLGDYKSMETPEEDVDWGTSRVWVDRVAARIPGEMDALRPSVFSLSEGPALRTRSTKTHEPRGSRGNRAGRGGRGGTRNAPVDPDGRHQDNTPIISGEDRNSLPRHGTPDRGSRSGEHNERGEPGEVKETMNTSYNANFNEGRHVVIGTVANERGRHSSSRGRPSRRGNGRGSGTGRDNRGRARRF